MRRKLIVLSILYVLASFCRSEAQKVTDSVLIKSFDERFLKMDSLILPPPITVNNRFTDSYSKKSYSFDNKEHPVLPYAGDSLLDQALRKRTASEIQALKSVTGLEFSGQGYYRPDENLGLDDDDAVSRYRGKIQVQVEWNILQSSLYKRKGRINELHIQEEIDRKKYLRDNLGLWANKQKEISRLQYDSLLAGVLLHRIGNLSLLSDAQHYLLRKQQISSDELLDILNEKAEAERLLATIDRKYVPATNLSHPKGVIVLVDTARLMAQVRATQYDLSTLELRMDYLEQRRKNTTYWGTTTLSPFIRYSYYTRSGLPNSSNVDLGVSFRLPLSAESHRKRKALQAEQAVLIAEKEAMSLKIVEDIQMIINDIERMNRSVAGEVQRLHQLKEYLTIRGEAYRNRIGGYSLPARLKEYNNYLSCWERLLSLAYQRDCLIADLQTFLTDTSVWLYCREVEL